jgi:hypothetical protein
MWQRRTFHDCASELRAISGDFCAAYTNRWGWDRAKCDRVMRDASTRGVEVLRILALSIRSDQDYGLTQMGSDSVGAFCDAASDSEASAFIQNYRPPYRQLGGFVPLGLRQALNKVAHANPARCGFFADGQTHDLILTGDDRGKSWIAVVSVIDLCTLIEAIPDASIHQ